jgi:hypothetical protein
MPAAVAGPMARTWLAHLDPEVFEAFARTTVDAHTESRWCEMPLSFDDLRLRVPMDAIPCTVPAISCSTSASVASRPSIPPRGGADGARGGPVARAISSVDRS